MEAETTPKPEEPTIHRVSESRFSWLSEKLAKLNKRAEKLGCKPITVTQTGEEMMVVVHNNGYGIDPDIASETREISQATYDKDPERYHKAGYRRYLLFTIDFEPIKFAGWTFVGALDHLTGDDEDTIVRCVPGQEMPSGFRTRGPLCDHCGTSRPRKETFVVRHDDGNYKTVGRQCLADFLGHVSPENLANMATWGCDVANLFSGDDEGFGSSEVTLFGLSDYLGWVASTIRVKGFFVSRKTANEQDRQSTSDIASHLMFMQPQTSEDHEIKAQYQPTDDDAKTVESALEWANALPGTSDYESNVRVLARLSVLGRKHFGLAASIVGCYLRDRDHERSAKTSKNGGWVGEIGKRMNLTLTVLTLKSFESDYGLTTLIKFEDADGNHFTWFASGGASEYEEGSTYDVKATVKKHNQHDIYSKDTLINRVKIVKSYPLEQTMANSVGGN